MYASRMLDYLRDPDKEGFQGIVVKIFSTMQIDYAICYKSPMTDITNSIHKHFSESGLPYTRSEIDKLKNWLSLLQLLTKKKRYVTLSKMPYKALPDSNILFDYLSLELGTALCENFIIEAYKAIASEYNVKLNNVLTVREGDIRYVYYKLFEEGYTVNLIEDLTKDSIEGISNDAGRTAKSFLESIKSKDPVVCRFLKYDVYETSEYDNVSEVEYKVTSTGKVRFNGTEDLIVK